jgi:hypothetical protein
VRDRGLPRRVGRAHCVGADRHARHQRAQRAGVSCTIATGITSMHVAQKLMSRFSALRMTASRHSIAITDCRKMPILLKKNSKSQMTAKCNPRSTKSHMPCNSARRTLSPTIPYRPALLEDLELFLVGHCSPLWLDLTNRATAPQSSARMLSFERGPDLGLTQVCEPHVRCLRAHDVAALYGDLRHLIAHIRVRRPVPQHLHSKSVRSFRCP